MMPDTNALSIAFLESHPADAARVLEGLDAADTAQFLAALPPRLAAPVLRHVGPPYCARVFAQLDDAQVGALTHVMGPQAAARALQQLPAERQLRLLAQLPVGTSIAIRLLIGYPKGTCGAAMDPWPLALAPETPVAEALEQTRSFEGVLGDCLFIANGDRRVLGVVSLAELMRAAPRDSLSAVMRPARHAVSALASMASANGHPGWEIFHALPVVERENRLVGALPRSAFNDAHAAPPPAPDAHLVAGTFGAYWRMLSALAELVVGTLPPVGPVAEERRKDER
jgi:magnesium transporter